MLSLILQNAIPFILRYYRIILVVAMVLAIFYYKMRYEAIASELEAYKAKQAILHEQQMIKIAKERADREKITNDVVNSYADSIKKVSDYYAKHPNVKFVTSSVCNETHNHGMSSTREISERANSGFEGTQETTSSGTATEIRVDVAAKEVIQCLELIKFNKEQDGY